MSRNPSRLAAQSALAGLLQDLTQAWRGVAAADVGHWDEFTGTSTGQQVPSAPPPAVRAVLKRGCLVAELALAVAIAVAVPVPARADLYLRQTCYHCNISI